MLSCLARQSVFFHPVSVAVLVVAAAQHPDYDPGDDDSVPK
ncbi:hypothetical protein [Aeromicrobium yanjiei]|nr:hypothetical protein [Aeromicrobium yanjiei]